MCGHPTDKEIILYFVYFVLYTHLKIIDRQTMSAFNVDDWE